MGHEDASCGKVMDIVGSSYTFTPPSSDLVEICGNHVDKKASLFEADYVTSESLIVQETILDYIKEEVEEEKQVQQDIEVQEEESSHQFGEVRIGLVKLESKDAGQSQQDTDVDDGKIEGSAVSSHQSKVTLKRQSSHDYAVISDMYSLLEDFKTMARSGRSLLCCQPPVLHALVMCVLCGDQFLGKADRLLQLFRHIEVVHPSDAFHLILETIQRYDVLITHMRKTIEFDKLFGTRYYSSGTMLLLPDL
ncbi:GTPase Era [Frankliniella fusca]|uniref:GTPase Era n=1 Tax=Frankliniella fusca TaxID=407009 RepID=A0AAE1H2E0_9NEOP|nr:GTPase Era [Frankliniella fusca]